MPSKKTYRLAKKMGMSKQRSGHGGARGNGSHLSSKGKDTSEASRREESKVKVASQKMFVNGLHGMNIDYITHDEFVEEERESWKN